MIVYWKNAFYISLSTVEKVRKRDLKDQKNSIPQTRKVTADLTHIHRSQKKKKIRAKPTFPFLSHPILLQNFRSLSKLIVDLVITALLFNSAG